MGGGWPLPACSSGSGGCSEMTLTSCPMGMEAPPCLCFDLGAGWPHSSVHAVLPKTVISFSSLGVLVFILSDPAQGLDSKKHGLPCVHRALAYLFRVGVHLIANCSSILNHLIGYLTPLPSKLRNSSNIKDVYLDRYCTSEPLATGATLPVRVYLIIQGVSPTGCWESKCSLFQVPDQ